MSLQVWDETDLREHLARFVLHLTCQKRRKSVKMNCASHTSFQILSSPCNQKETTLGNCNSSFLPTFSPQSIWQTRNCTRSSVSTPRTLDRSVYMYGITRQLKKKMNSNFSSSVKQILQLSAFKWSVLLLYRSLAATSYHVVNKT